MAIFTNTDDVSGLLPEDYGSLIVQPVTQQSVAFQVADVIPTSLHDYVIPIVTEDPSASWVAEGQEIAESDPSFDKIVITPKKLAGLTETTSEMLEDSDPAADDIIGAGIARDIAKKVDLAFFGDLADPAPKGLQSIAAEVTNISGPMDTLDIFAAAVAASEEVGGTISHFVMNPTDYLTLRTIKKGLESNEALLSGAGTDPVGAPVLRSPAVPAGVIWGIPSGYAKVILRKDVEIKTSGDAAFTRDAVLVRAIMRIGFGFPHPKAIVRIALTEAGTEVITA